MGIRGFGGGGGVEGEQQYHVTSLVLRYFCINLTVLTEKPPDDL